MDDEIRPRAVPYPADVRADGWSLLIDAERILKLEFGRPFPDELPPCLSMMQIMAWQQIPCGSLPSNEESLTQIIGIPVEIFKNHRAYFMGEWWEAEDGRLYCDALVALVAEMRALRISGANRWPSAQKVSSCSSGMKTGRLSNG